MKPQITLADVRSALRPPFIMKEIQEHGWILFDYSFAYPGLFEGEDGDVLLECRGITFDAVTGDIVSRPYHKFFNAGEQPGTSIADLDLTRDHRILEKLDGSMLRPMRTRDGKILFGTRKGPTDVAAQVDVWVKNHPNYIDFCNRMLTGPVPATPIFEWCSRQMRIVIDHPVDRLVLTGIRRHHDGSYLSYENMVALATMFNIDVVRAFDVSTKDRAFFAEYIRGLQDMEGFVIRFEDGLSPQMVKVKADAYLEMHGTLDIMRSEKTVFECLIKGLLDDVKVRLRPDDLARVTEFEAAFFRAVGDRARECSDLVQATAHLSRKDFALTVAVGHPAKSVLFQLFGGQDHSVAAAQAAIMNQLGKGTQDGNEIRAFLNAPNLQWISTFAPSSEE